MLSAAPREQGRGLVRAAFCERLELVKFEEARFAATFAWNVDVGAAPGSQPSRSDLRVGLARSGVEQCSCRLANGFVGPWVHQRCSTDA
jgi:hypothetical protein